ncbi:MAG: D-alanyl-D-alanine carboxypeptidase family protein [Firmicutes bacterium]|nr:D-alanyl-D-alanine carboxypeptidase family protein [Bacillota bacterium]
MNKKNIIISLLILILTGCQEKSDTQIENIIPYYKQELENRYQSYKDKNPNLTEEEIITNVNIGLDSPFYTNTKQTDLSNHITLLTNKYLYLPEDYIPKNLESINKNFTNGTKQLVKEAKIAFEKMATDAKQEGYNIRAISAYRSYSYQQVLYQKYVLNDGPEKADTYSARPGFSEHQTGLVVDIDNIKRDFNNFESTEEFKWMTNNAHDYGFILRYPKGKEHITGYQYEAWHYRYVGEKIAKNIKKENTTYDEYYIKYLDN